MKKQIRASIELHIKKLRKEFGIRITHREHLNHKTNFSSLIGVNGLHFLKDTTLEHTLQCLEAMYQKNKEITIPFKRISLKEYQKQQQKKEPVKQTELFQGLN